MWLSPYFPMVVWAVVSALVSLVVGYYAMIRLRFALFHRLVHRTGEFRQGWRQNGRTAFRMFWACGLGWAFPLVCAGVEGGVVATGGLAFVTSHGEDGKPDPGVLLIMYLVAFLTAVVLLALVATVRIVLHDFLLCHLALEKVTLTQAWRDFRKIVRAERENFVSYLLVRMVLSVVPWAVIAAIATALGYLAIWIWSATALGYDVLLDNMGGIADYVRLFLDVIFTLLGIATGVLLSIALGGPLAVFTRTFALMFYAGRYARLGDAMYPASAQTERNSV